jgi:precorrin-6Y C5,15-methyltransferase (decarboxylating)
MTGSGEQIHIYMIGIGMGDPRNLTVEAKEIIEAADLLVGARRMLLPYQGKKKCEIASRPDEIVNILWKEKESREKIAILMSGDSGFYSGTKALLAALCDAWGEEVPRLVTVLPGISSVAYFSAKLGQSWEDAAIVNLHGAKENLWQAVLTHEKVFAITGGNAQQSLQELAEHGLGDIHGFVGENLSYGTEFLFGDAGDVTAEKQTDGENRCERIYQGTVGELAQHSYDTLSVLYLENPAAVSTHLWGLPDHSFVRGEVPMTKAEIRAVVMSKLRIREKDIVYDVGAGTGSVSVEMALAARKGIVYSIESNFDALELCKLNKRRFCLENMEIIEGKAPDVLDELPAPDVVFIGGSRGKLPEIVEALLEKNPALRLVINTITVESTASAAALLDTERFAGFEMVQVQVSRGKKVGTSHMMLAQNTVTILSARGKGRL